MNILILPTRQAWARAAAREIARQIRHKPGSVLGLATGSTMVRLYESLVEIVRLGQVDFSRVVIFALDEYAGLPKSHPAGCYARLHGQFLDHVSISPQNIYFPDALAGSPEQECQLYEQAIQEHGGIDLQVLGLGLNGHLGFNEPGALFDSTTHLAELADSSRQSRAEIFGGVDCVPRQGITLGLKTILQARKLLLLACGQAKAGIIAESLYGAVTPAVPASVLQRHPDLTVVLDREAGALINPRAA